jgi:DNA-binding transcriptional MerR regulator
MRMELLTVSGAARRLEKSEKTIRHWSDIGRLRTAARLQDGTRLFHPRDVDAASGADANTASAVQGTER